MEPRRRIPAAAPTYPRKSTMSQTIMVLGAASLGVCLGFTIASMLHAGADADQGAE
jgi:hypothetical protein